MSENYDIVWLEEERTYAYLITLGAYFSVIKYTREGIDYEVVVANDEYEYAFERGTDDEN